MKCYLKMSKENNNLHKLVINKQKQVNKPLLLLDMLRDLFLQNLRGFISFMAQLDLRTDRKKSHTFSIILYK